MFTARMLTMLSGLYSVLLAVNIGITLHLVEQIKSDPTSRVNTDELLFVEAVNWIQVALGVLAVLGFVFGIPAWRSAGQNMSDSKSLLLHAAKTPPQK